ncbi:Asp-tRNA(Asn)/Glu-tRNA(Gln) amidotransferase subunit GatA, partial [Pseudoflavonifractor phocaeensis]|nr:Asp-tRNA(Asn)/Glu-tRNA(Gln) amidotransferase subunit GatA [Pseudoflavonifractor phocaeensis]
MELYELTALELAQKLRTGEVSQQEAMETAAARISAAQPANNAFTWVNTPLP